MKNNKYLPGEKRGLKKEAKGFTRLVKILTWIIGMILGFVLVNWVLIHISISIVQK